jgi:hypothetical protein
MKKFLLFALVAVVSLLASCSRSQRFQGGNRKLYDTITVYSVDKIVETSGNKESFGTETYYLVATDNNSSLKFEIMAKQLYVASQRVL